ncbi:TlpA family protein disulfide reductase [Oligoflexus tunisiensis]|uniref:TlpA family protein disulfide reductase n=1 Tax=Oligoflexus tunisiensis TaxID=708132 RepID=UPI000AFF3C9B|nr:TlpA disulfide reductase family protein [Oligoflexus tunisiensis]
MLKLNRKTLKSGLKNGVIFLALVYAVEYWQSRNMTKGELPEPLRHVSLPTLKGTTRSLWNPEKLTVVYVFAPWCGVCRASGSNIDRLPQDFHKTALALSWDQIAAVDDFVRETGLQVPVLMGKEREEEALRIGAYPSYLIIDTQGRIVKAWSGYTTTAGLWFKSYWARLVAARE